MRCMDCIVSTITRDGPEFEAEWILFGDTTTDYQVKILCDPHLQQYREGEGDMNIDYKRIDEGVWFEVIEEVNKTLKYLNNQYARLLREYTTQKKQLAELTSKVETP